MEQTGLSAALAAMQRDFSVETVETPKALNEALRLRYQVYCLERNFEPGLDGLETDDFDPISRHILLRYQPTGQAIGTVRLVIPQRNGPAAELPMERVVSLARIRQLPRDRVAEVSRFALSKSHRCASGSLGYLLRLALIRGIVQLSGQMGLTHWCALMEPKLLRLLQMSAIYFHQAGGIVEHHGFRQPSYIGLGDMLNRVRREKPAIWDFITDHGALWQPDRHHVAA